jgi:hypothetical protein
MPRYGILEEAGPAAFSLRADEFLHAREPENGLLIGLASTSPPGSRFYCVGDDRTTVLAALQPTARKLLISRGPAEAATDLARHLHAMGRPLPGVFAPDENGHAFAVEYARSFGSAVRLGLRMRVHAIEQVNDLARPRGSLRRALPEEHPLLAEWSRGFLEETGADDPRSGEQIVADASAPGRLWVWTDGARPVTMVSWGRPTRTGAAIHCVYTPPDLRSLGYATAAVAEVTSMLLNNRRFVCLFTDLASPAPNAVYAKVGYRGLCDYADHWFA